MTFHSVQEVQTNAGHELMQVFECEKCHQLAAFHGLAAAANTKADVDGARRSGHYF